MSSPKQAEIRPINPRHFESKPAPGTCPGLRIIRNPGAQEKGRQAIRPVPGTCLRAMAEDWGPERPRETRHRRPQVPRPPQPGTVHDPLAGVPHKVADRRRAAARKRKWRLVAQLPDGPWPLAHHKARDRRQGAPATGCLLMLRAQRRKERSGGLSGRRRHPGALPQGAGVSGGGISAAAGGVGTRRGTVAA